MCVYLNVLKKGNVLYLYDVRVYINYIFEFIHYYVYMFQFSEVAKFLLRMHSTTLKFYTSMSMGKTPEVPEIYVPGSLFPFLCVILWIAFALFFIMFTSYYVLHWPSECERDCASV